MNWQIGLSILLVGLGGAFAAGLSFVVWQRRPAPGVLPLTGLLVGVAIWSISYAFDLGVPDLAGKIFWSKIEYAGIASVPLFWFLFALTYSGLARQLPGWFFAVLAPVPVATALFAWTNEAHGLIWASIRLAESDPWPQLMISYGPWFWVYVIYAYLCLILGTAVLLWWLARRATIYREQAFALGIGAVAPLLGNVGYLTGTIPGRGIDLTPFAFVISASMIMWALYRYKLLDIVPVAFEGVVRDMTDGVLVLSSHDLVVALNPAAESILGTPDPIRIGEPIDRLFVSQPTLAGRLKTGSAEHGEIILERDGTEHYYDLRVSPLHDGQGRLSGRILVLRDLSDRRRAESEHLQLIEEQAARGASDAALRTRNEVLSTVSHDLKNPLSTIKITASRLRRRISGTDHPEESRLIDGLERVETMAARMTTILDELVEVTRLQLGQRLDLDTGPTDLVALAHWVAASQQPGDHRTEITVCTALPELVGPWDAPRLERVLTNLVSNAVKYSPNGAVQIGLTTECGNPPTWAVLMVRDEGVGIPADDLPHVFDWFFRAGNVAGRIGGTGIGLASAQQVVEQHGGCISVESEEGRGSTFTVRLPLGNSLPAEETGT